MSAATGAPGLSHVLDRDDDLEVELLRAPGVHELDRSAAGHEAADLLERALGRRQADALQRLLDQPLEPLDREREMRAPLRAGNGVYLVQDQRLDRRSGSRGRAT